jgi:predicted transcriptional regulator
VLVLLNKKRKKTEMARQQAEEQSHFFKTKYLSATQQLEAFRNDIIEKNTLIDRLQEELENRQLTADKNVETITQLSSQVLLTENDWQQFKTTFDSVYPHFFTTLKASYSEITNAELRMASLIKLNFDTRHIASMLGISQDSVHKTRYRLRKRINDSGTASLEELIGAL